MAQLIQMRQRIKTVETIKKITHAMRLIAMAAHGNLKQQRVFVEQYQNHIAAIFADVRAKNTGWQTALFDLSGQSNKKLLILIASQKGLCGNFNSVVFDFFNKNIGLIGLDTTVVAVGKNAVDFLENKYQVKPTLSIHSISIATCFSIAKRIVEFIKTEGLFSSAVVVSNFPKTFFMQYPRSVELSALLMSAKQTIPLQTDYIFEEPVETVLECIADIYITTVVHMLLLESLLAEQAARFISMDNSTRNAENLLETTKLSYNKLRQAKITCELIELSGSDV